jgi:hypothetical protein
MKTRKNRQTGTHITVVHGDELGAYVEPGYTVWYTFCEEHKQSTGHPTKAIAMSWAAEPLGWCEVCNGNDVLDEDDELEAAAR